MIVTGSEPEARWSRSAGLGPPGPGDVTARTTLDAQWVTEAGVEIMRRRATNIASAGPLAWVAGPGDVWFIPVGYKRARTGTRRLFLDGRSHSVVGGGLDPGYRGVAAGEL